MICIRHSINYSLYIFVLLFCMTVHAAQISVMTDIDPVSIDRSFQIIFESSGSVDDEPDFSPLDVDFQVLSSSTSSNMSIINSRVSRTKRWQLTVLARRIGRLTIPSIRFGRDKSDRTTIRVVNTTANKNLKNNNRDIFIEIQASPQKAYVQSQIKYKIRLFRAIATSNASLSDPVITGANAVIERLGEDSSYETTRMGKRFAVIERVYAIYPQTSGRMTIEPVRFQAQSSRGSFFTFDPFGPQAKMIVIQSEPVKLDILPVPDAFTGNHWLPAQKLQLKEQWSENPPEFIVGEPVTRTLSLTAVGLTASQLPELPEWTTSGFRQYPDQPSLTNSKTALGVTGKRIEKIAMIANQAGNYVLPEIRIPWWNTATDSLEYAIIPARKILVTLPLSGSDQHGAVIAPAPADVIYVEKAAGQIQSSGDLIAIVDTPGQPEPRYWQWLSLGLALGWFVSIIVWWLSRRHPGKDMDKNDNTDSIKLALTDLKQACSVNNTADAKDILLRWGKIVWAESPPASIGDIGNRCRAELASEIHLLNNVLYNRNQGSWQGEQFWQVFMNEQKHKGKKHEKKSDKLEPLYRL